METENIPKDEFRGGNKIPESNIEQEPFQQPSKKRSMPTIAGILLILAGVIALLSWISATIAIDISTIESAGILSLFQETDPTITAEQAKELLTVCGIIGCILSVFPILGGILSLKRKMWRIALAGGILGLLTIFTAIIPGILCSIGLILIAMSKQEFRKHSL